MSPFYNDWRLLGTILVAFAGLCGGVWWIVRRDDSEVDESVLEIKQALTSMFMTTVITEARRLLHLVEDHLPSALSQENEQTRPGPSRFYRFCESLRRIDEAELDNRGRYSSIIQEVFGGIVKDQLSKLLSAADPGPRTVASALGNPTGIRFQLEGSTELTLAFVSEVRSSLRRRERQFRQYFKLAKFSLISAAALLILLWIPGVLINATWAYRTSLILMVGTAVLTAVGLFGVLMFESAAMSILRDSRAYRSSEELAKTFEEWKAQGRG